MDVSIKDRAIDCVTTYAGYVNKNRAFPNVIDGLKRVQRAIFLATNISRQKSATIVGDVIGHYNPHGDSGAYGALVHLVNTYNVPFIKGKGNFGGEALTDIPVAAMRYTEASLSPLSKLTLKYVNYVEEFTNDLDKSEPVGLAVPFPVCLLSGSIGVGVGTYCIIPPYDIDSVIDHTKWLISPTKTKKLLKLYSGAGTVEFDEDEVTSKAKFKVVYHRPYRIETIDNRTCFITEGTVPFMKASRIVRGFQEQLSSGNMFVRDSTREEPKIMVGRESRIRLITDQEIENRVRENLTRRLTANLVWSNKGLATMLSASDAISKSLEFLKKAVKRRLDEVYAKKSIIFKANEYSASILKELANGEERARVISANLGLPHDVVSFFLDNSIRYIRSNAPSNREIERLEKLIANPGVELLEFLEEFRSIKQ